MRTLFLLPDTWDLALDVNGNIAVAEQTYQQAQDIASACRVFTKDMYYNQSEGIPYLEEILGKEQYPLSLYQKYLTDAALSVPEIEQATVSLETLENRILTGSIVFTNADGQTGEINL